MSPCQSSLASVPGSLDESPAQSRQNVATDPKAMEAAALGGLVLLENHRKTIGKP